MTDLDTLMDIERKKVKWLLLNAIVNGDCLECHLSRDKDGYAQVGVNRKNYRAHRLVYKHCCGEIGTFSVLHSCDNPCCINPDHLFLGTQADNITDMILKGRRANVALGTRALSDNVLDECAYLHYGFGVSQGDLARKFRVNQSTICLSLRRWKKTQEEVFAYVD